MSQPATTRDQATRKRRGCTECRLIEPEPGQWVNGLCPECTAVPAQRIPAPANKPFKASPLSSDITGQTFGRLMVLRREGSVRRGLSGQTRATWLCRCSCGQEKVLIGAELRAGRILSCGCFRKERLRTLPGELRAKGRQAHENYRRSGLSQEEIGELRKLRRPRRDRQYQRKGPRPSPALDLQGQTFSRLTVLRRTETRGKWKPVYWLCRCECGNEKEASTNSLRTGKVRSCGCLRSDKSVAGSR